MLRYIYGHDELVAAGVAQMIPHMHGRGFGPCKAVGIADRDGRLIGGVVYHDYNPEAGVIMVSGAALPKSRWLTRETIRRVFAYPFEQLGVQLIVQMTPADDERALRQLAAFGYMFVEVPRMLGRDRAAVLCLLTREAWQSSKFIRRPDLVLEEAA